MTVRKLTISSLKQLKNTVIGNPSAKLSLARDAAFVHLLVGCLNHPTPCPGEPQGSQDDIRIEAVHVISSLAYGSDAALSSLLRANALQEIIRALANPAVPNVPLLKAALARGLRVLASAVAEAVGPSNGPLRTYAPELRAEAKAILNYLLQYDCLDVYLPLLQDSSLQTAQSVAQLLAAVVLTDTHRAAIIEWLPFQERQKEPKGRRRGWEKHDIAHITASGRQGAWVLRHLITMIQHKDLKMQEAALGAIGTLAADNQPVASFLAKPLLGATVPPLSLVLALMKSRVESIQLAASLCTVYIIRAQATHSPGTVDPGAALAVMHVINRILTTPSEQSQNQIKACTILYLLVRDEKDLCVRAAEHGILNSLACLVKSITPIDNNSDWEMDEPENRISLRETALKAIAAISLFDKLIKRDVADTLGLIPVIQACLTQKSVGVRCAACHCMRSLTRDTAVMQTNITDSGAGMAVYRVFKKEDEDLRVTTAALAAICNLVSGFSPLGFTMLEDGLLPRLMQLFAVENQKIRVSVLWAIKNLLAKSVIATKVMAITHLGWSHLAKLTSDSDPEIQEQAFSILRNLTEDEAGLDLVFRSTGDEFLINCLSTGLDSYHECVSRETAHVLGHIANGTRAQQDLVFKHSHILEGMRHCLADAHPSTRVPLMTCLHGLLQTNPRRQRDLVEAGFLSPLQHLCEWTGRGIGGGISASPGISVSMSMSIGRGAASPSPSSVRAPVHQYHRTQPHHHQISLEDEREAAELARRVLHFMDASTIGEML